MEMHSNLSQYKEAIRNIDISKLQKSTDIPTNLQMATEGKLTINYIPFDHVNDKAKIVLVGITPGLTQLRNALKEAQIQIKAGASDQAILQAAKKTAAFSGAMRPNLVAMLDDLNVDKLLGIKSTELLFSEAHHLVHTTSVLRHPVFIDGENYNGTPNMTKNSLLLKFLTEHFVKEAEALKDAIFIPMGPKVLEAMNWLVQQGKMNGANILGGLPHPSPANAERIMYFLGRKAACNLSIKTNPQMIDATKAGLIKKINSLRS